MSDKKPNYETFKVDANVDSVCCDGGHETLGHPKTWYNFTGKDKNFAVCHYCNRIFIKSS